MKPSMLRKLILSIRNLLKGKHRDNCSCHDCQVYRVFHHIAIEGDR